jgi:peptidyl-Lys metalloendopeptidase
VDLAFVQAPRLGESSRVGTMTHEMSHFLVAGGTKDHTYGTAKCKQLARSDSALALTNADNFEFWAENAP